MRKIKWGVLGTAGIARGCTVPGIVEADNAELYAVAGRTQEKLDVFREKFEFEKVYLSYEELLADPEVEAVYIPLANELHCEWTCKALRAGKHVLCEKPLAPTVAEMEEMMRTANECGRYLMEAFAYLHNPVQMAVKAEVDSGAIGDLIYMESCFLTSDYDPNNIRMRKETFGGSTYDLGCYTTSQILWMFGEEPETVQAVAEYTDAGIDSYTTGLLTFKGNRRAVFSCGMMLARPPYRRMDRFQLHGTKGWIKSEAGFNHSGDLSYRIFNYDDGVEHVKTVNSKHNYRLEVEQLGRCILEGEQPHVSHEFTLMNGRTIARILDSIGYNK